MRPEPASGKNLPEDVAEFRDVIEVLTASPPPPVDDLAPRVLSRIRRRRMQRRVVLTGLVACAVGFLAWPPWEGPDLTLGQKARVSAADDWQQPESPSPSSFALMPADPRSSSTALRDVGSLETSLAMAREWLIRHQHPDGGWESIEGRPSSYRVGATSLAMLALMVDSPDDAVAEALRRARDFLVSNRQADGLFGPAITGSAYNHALACLALARLEALLPSDRQGAEALHRGLSLLARGQHADGGWGYFREGAEPNTGVTVWVLEALLEAERAGITGFTKEIERGIAWLERAISTDGRAGYRRAGDFPNGPETLTAAVAACLLKSKRAPSPLVARMIERVRADATHFEVFDYYRCFFQSAALAAVPEGVGDWESLVATVQSLQETSGDDAGSWPPIDRWSRAGGRAYSTAMAVLALRSL